MVPPPRTNKQTQTYTAIPIIIFYFSFEPRQLEAASSEEALSESTPLVMVFSSSDGVRRQNTLLTLRFFFLFSVNE
jgi:hypothetical protein